ncbi:hypothetical protein RAB80_001607 [Fusarium oxysporum f. sp. vasinfectum]|nr:hypothetical protein RAB80_001607 [Fusarium oxysporum f. sp. vasinfectum]
MAGGAASMSPTSPVSSRHGHGHGNSNGTNKRKRSSMIGIESSPGSNLDDHDAEQEKKRQPGVKRACNECRQQKLRCDVVQDPFQSCSRCNRLKLECKIESNFKRVGKRSKHAEMEKEIDRLRRSLARAKSQGFTPEADDDMDSPIAASNPTYTHTHTRNPSLMGSDEAVSSLLHLKRGGNYNMPRYSHDLENVKLTEEDVNNLFRQFWAFYHQFLPFLNPSQAPDLFYQQHPPPLLQSLGTSDTFLVVNDRRSPEQLLRGQGHVPAVHMATTHKYDFVRPYAHFVWSDDENGYWNRVSVELNKEQLNDRVTTWAVCNIVAQSVGTGYGQPASTLYDWTLASRAGEESAFQLSRDLEARLQIERFCDKVSKEMYSNASDPRGVAGDEHRAMLMRVYRRDYAELNASILSQGLGPIVSLHLRAAALHMRLAGFFDSSKTPGYMDDLMGLWRATTAFLDEILEVDQATSPRDGVGGHLLLHCSNYIGQMMVAAGFALLKLMRSFFSKTIDFQRGRTLFHQTIRAIRATSVVNNDLQWRLAELMVQMWNGARLEHNQHNFNSNDNSPIQMDDSLQLKVRCRHSMSLVFDSVWRWREDFQASGRGTIDSAKQPTNPDSANESSASSTHMDSTLVPSHTLPPSRLSAVSSAHSMMAGVSYGDAANYDFFDPQHWMLDGLLDFNYSYVPPLEGA